MDPVFVELLAIDDLEFLVEMELRAPNRFGYGVHRRLLGYDREQVDRGRLDALQRWPTAAHRRASLARSIDPRAGDEQAWLNLAQSETNELERLTRRIQADLASQREDPWQHTLTVIDRLATMLESPLEHYDRERVAVSTPDEPISEEAARYVLGNAVGEILVLLGQGLARGQPPPNREVIIRRVFASPRLRACILGGVCSSWWAVASDLLGESYVIDVLRSGHDDHVQASLVRLRSIGLSRTSLIALAGDACLGLAAATVLSEQIADGVTEALGVDEITKLLAERRLDPESDAIRALVSSYLNTSPQNLAQLTAIMEQHLEPEARVIWWRNLASEIGDPRTLAVLLDAWLVNRG